MRLGWTLTSDAGVVRHDITQKKWKVFAKVYCDNFTASGFSMLGLRTLGGVELHIKCADLTAIVCCVPEKKE